MKLIVCGATGYIGSRLLAVAASAIRTVPTASKVVPGFLQFDLLAPSDGLLDVIEPEDVLVMAAAISSPDVCNKEFESAWKVNVNATGDFVRQAIDRGARVIFLSSDTIYGECHTPFDESYAGVPAGPYARMKRALELRFEGSNAFKSIRLSYVFSKVDKFTRYLEACARSGKSAELFHPFLRSVVYRDDVATGIVGLALRWTEVQPQFINFGGPQTLSRIEFAEILKKQAMPSMHYSISEPDDIFFVGRPRCISMKSPIFPSLLGHDPRTLAAAAALEFCLLE